MRLFRWHEAGLATIVPLRVSGGSIWLPSPNGPIPVAAIINGIIFAIQADHLNTPRRLSNTSAQAVWQWKYSAFGDEQPTLAANRFADLTMNPNPGTTTIPAVTFNLRYPGQYADAESGLNYNYFRSYNSDTGGYTQSDSIGLDGGWNRFGYVRGNPRRYADPTGLILITGVPGAIGETSIHANPGPNATTFRPEHGPDHIHLGSNEGPRVRTSDFEPLSDADALKMTRQQRRFCSNLSDESKDLIRGKQRNIFDYGTPERPEPSPKIPPIRGLALLSAHSATSSIRMAPVETTTYLVDMEENAKMTKNEFMKLMRFPEEWLGLGMYPDELFAVQLSGYAAGDENGSEHDRNGAFHWWLRQHPTKEQLQSLLRLASLDPDPALGNDVRTYVRIAKAFDEELALYDKELFGR